MASIAMYVLPAAMWNRPDAAAPPPPHALLSQLLREAVDLRRRIGKGANLAAERMRYSTCLAELENRLQRLNSPIIAADPDAIVTAWKTGQLPAITLPEQYFDLMARAQLQRLEQRSALSLKEKTATDADQRVLPGLGGTVYPPEVLAAHRDELLDFRKQSLEADQTILQEVLNQRLHLVQLLLELGAGVVEVTEVLDNRDVAPPVPRPYVPATVTRPTVVDEPPEPITAKGRRKMEQRLEQEIEQALKLNDKVNMSAQPHDVSTEVLARFIYQSKGTTPGQIRIIYADGSEAKPFPLRGLPVDPSPGVASVELSVALMSMRHLELDPIVDWSWYRNKEVSQTRPLAESDDFCFQYSQQQLEELRETYHGERVLLKMYHTGFEPASMGFYRAVTTMLLKHRGWLKVVPHYFRGGSYFQVSDHAWQ